MSDRKDAFTGQLVTQQFYDQCFDQVEAADRAQTSDSGFTGIYEGLGVAQHAGTPDLTVDVSVGTAYAPAGERMRNAVLERINCAVDRDGISTTVTGALNGRIISVIARPDRVLSDPQTDAASQQVYTQRTESLVIEVVQGSEAVVPSAPAIPAGSTLLADIQLTFGMTEILTASIATTGSAARRQDAFLLTGSTFFVRTGKAKQAMQDIVTRYNNHVEGGGDQHEAGDLVYGGSGFWADGSTTVGNGTVDTAISEVVSDLASMSTADAGEQRIGCEQDVSIAANILAASTLRARLRAIRLATNLYYAGGPTWADSSAGPVAGTVEAAIDSIVSTIAASTGAAKMGMAAVGNFTAGTTQAMIAQLAATTASNDGAKRIGTQSSGNFAGVTVRAQIDELTGTGSNDDGAKRVGAQARGNFASGTIASQLAELVATTAANDGAKKVGAQANGTLSTGTVRSQLDQLDTLKAALAGATFTGEVKTPRVAVTRQNIGVIAANTQILDNVGVIEVRAPATNVQLNIALPEPANGGTQVIFIKFRGGNVGAGRIVYIVDTANLAVNNPTDYYAYWNASDINTKSAGCIMYWDDTIPTRWRMISAWHMSGEFGGGSLADTP